MAEAFMIDYHRSNGVDVGIVRIFNTYGPCMAFDGGWVVSNFVLQVLKGEPLTVYGQGGQTRSFCYVSDIVAGLMAMMECKGFIGPVNLGNPSEFTILDLTEKVLAMIGSKSPIEHRPLPVDDPVQRRPDIALAKARLGWEPAIPLEQGLAATIEDFRRRRAGD